MSGDKLVELFKSEIAKSAAGTARLYTPSISKLDHIVAEFEFENLTKLDKIWENWLAKPETTAFYEKMNELIEAGGYSEVWNLVEL